MGVIFFWIIMSFFLKDVQTIWTSNSMGKSTSLLFFWPVMDWIMMLSIFQSFSIPSAWWERVTWRGSQSSKDDVEWGGGDTRPIIAPWDVESCLTNQWFAAADECSTVPVSLSGTLSPSPLITSFPKTRLWCFFAIDHTWSHQSV